jgi:quercetin dioxygenase-like cupin family protein
VSAAAMTAEEILIAGIDVRFLVDPEATEGAATLFEFDVQADGHTPPPHSHERWEETVYGVRGTLTWTVDGVAKAVGPGEVLVIPRGVVHSFENSSRELATQLAVVTPGLLGPGYFRDLAAIFSVDGPPDLAAALDVMRRHGLTPAL